MSVDGQVSRALQFDNRTRVNGFIYEKIKGVQFENKEWEFHSMESWKWNSHS